MQVNNTPLQYIEPCQFSKTDGYDQAGLFPELFDNSKKDATCVYNGNVSILLDDNHVHSTKYYREVVFLYLNVPTFILTIEPNKVETLPSVLFDKIEVKAGYDDTKQEVPITTGTLNISFKGDILLSGDPDFSYDSGNNPGERQYSLSLLQGANNYITLGDGSMMPQPSDNLSVIVEFKLLPGLNSGEKAIFFSRYGGATGIILQYEYPTELLDEPGKIMIQFGAGNSSLVRNVELNTDDVHRLELQYNGSTGTIDVLALNGGSITRSLAAGSTSFDNTFVIDYNSHEFTSREIDNVFVNIFGGKPNNIPDVRGSFDLHSIQYAINGNSDLYSLTEGSGNTITSDNGTQSEIYGPATWNLLS